MTDKVLIAGRYEMRHKLFEHEHLLWIRAYDKGRGEDVLLVRLPPEDVLPASTEERIRRATATAMQSRARGRIPVLGIREDATGRWMVCAWPPGQNLWLDSAERGARVRDWDSARRLGRALAGALDRAPGEDLPLAPHTPKQVWSTPEGDAQVLDLRALAAAHEHPHDLVFPGEDAYGAGSLDATGGDGSSRTQAAFVAAVLYEELTGDPPRGRVAPIRKRAPDVPQAAARVIDRALEGGPPGKAPELHDLDATLAPAPTRRGVSAGLLLVGLLVLLASGVAALWQFGWLSRAETLLRASWGAQAAEDEAPSTFGGQGEDEHERDAEAWQPFLGRFAALEGAPSLEGGEEPDSLRLEVRPDGSALVRTRGPDARYEGTWEAVDGSLYLDLSATAGGRACWEGLSSLRRAGTRMMFTCADGLEIVLQKTHWQLGGAFEPAVEWTSPPEGGLTSLEAIVARGRVATVPGGSARLEVEGGVVEMAGRDFRVRVPLRFEGEASIPWRFEGPDGLVTEGERHVHVDRTPPRIVARGGAVGDGSGRLRIRGTVTDDVRVARFFIDGYEVSLDEHGAFDVERGLPGGVQRRLELQAWDTAGNEALQEVSAGLAQRRGPSSESLLRAALKAGEKGDFERAGEALARARAGGLDADRIPLWLLQGIARPEQGPRLHVDHPTDGMAFDSPIIPVRGRLFDLPEGARLFIQDRPVEWEGDRFEAEASMSVDGEHTLVVEVRYPDGDGLRREIRVTTSDPYAGILTWTRGRLSRAQREWARRLELPVGFENRFGMRFILMPPGTYVMGFSRPKTQRSREVEKPHEVQITRPFYLQITEVTNEQYTRKVAAHRLEEYRDQKLDLDDQPAVLVSHQDATEYAQWLSRKDAERTYRLPTEAEWEYAARGGGSSDVYYWKGGKTGLSRHANVADRSTRRALGDDWKDVYDIDDRRAVSAPVGTYEPNDYGLFDMVGNVAEWCSDWFAPYPTDVAVDPQGPESGVQRVYRGGSWRSGPGFARLSLRSRAPTKATARYLGFRLVAEVPER